MTSSNDSTRRLARVAGVLYLLIIVFGVAGEAAVRAPLVSADAGQTMANLLRAETWFRLSILGDMVMVLADVALGTVLFVLLAPVDRTLSLMAMAFRLAQAAVLGLNLEHLHRAVTLAHDTALDVSTRARLVTGALDAHAAGYDLGLFFFAANCALMAVLLLRSRWVPRALGVGAGAAALVYLVGSSLRIAAPPLASVFAPAYVVPLLAELALCAWLLTKGLEPPDFAPRRAEPLTLP